MRSLRSSPQAAGIDAARPARDGAVPAAEAGATGGGDWAICCSGGGIRSAAYCLGALQSLDSGGLLETAKWIVGVSGGSYIASSRALVAHDLPPGTVPHAYAPGTAEERNFRDNTRYIAPNGATVLVGVLSLLLGAIVTFIIVTAPIYAFTHAWGWLLRWQGVLVPSGPRTMTAAATGTAWWLPSVIGAGITLVLFAFWWLTLEPPLSRRHTARVRWWAWLKPDDPDRSANRAKVVSWAALLTAGLALAMLAAPPLISWLTRSTGSFGTVARALGLRREAGLVGRGGDRPGRRGGGDCQVLPGGARQVERAERPGELGGGRAAELPHHAGRRAAPAAAAVAGQRRDRPWRRGARAAVDQRRRPVRIHRGPAPAGHRRAGRDGLRPGGRERQPHVAARCLPVAAGQRVRRHPAGGAGAEPGARTPPVRRGRRDPAVRASGRIGAPPKNPAW